MLLLGNSEPGSHEMSGLGVFFGMEFHRAVLDLSGCVATTGDAVMLYGYEIAGHLLFSLLTSDHM